MIGSLNLGWLKNGEIVKQIKVQKLIASMPDRIQAVLANKGPSINCI